MKKTILLGILILSFTISNAQDPSFYNSNQSLIYLNPSFAGSNGGIRNQASYRNQWPQTSYNFSTYLNTVDLYIKAIRGGLAVSAMHDDVYSGLLKTTKISLSYAQYLGLLKGTLKVIPSVQFSYAKRTADYGSLSFDDPRTSQWGITEPNSSKQYFDFGAGLLVNYKNKLFIGTSFFHINQPDGGLLWTYKLPVNFNFHASYNFKLSEKSCLQALYRTNSQSMFWTNRLGLNLVSFNHLITGIGLVNWEEPVLSAGYRNNYFNLLIGYDFTLSKLAGNTAGNWELHASFNLRNKEQRKQLTSFESW